MTVLSVPPTAGVKVPLVIDDRPRRRRNPLLMEAGEEYPRLEHWYSCVPGFWRFFGALCVLIILTIAFMIYSHHHHCMTHNDCRYTTTAAVQVPCNRLRQQQQQQQQQPTVEDVAPSYDASDDDDDDDDDEDASDVVHNNNSNKNDRDDDESDFRARGFDLPLEVSVSSPLDLFNSPLFKHLFVPRPFGGQPNALPATAVTRSARFIHDYNVNVTGVVDVEAHRCYVMPLLRESLLPPTSLYDLMVKVSSGYYSLDVQKVVDGMRKVEPPVQDLSAYGEHVSKECAGYVTYRLEKDVLTAAVSSAAPIDTTVGPEETVVGHKETAVGPEDTAVGHKKTAVGHEETAVDPKETVVGPKETAVGPKETAAGPKEFAAGPEETAVGHKETAVGPEETAAGAEDTASAQARS